MSAIHRVRPSLDRLWAAFPDHERYPTLKDLYVMFGGVAEQNIDAKGFGQRGNTCASRISYALNHGGAPISRVMADSVGAETIGTADGSRIIFRVSHLRAYLIRAFGTPEIDSVSPFDDRFRKQKGIIAFAVANWTDASGHIALFRNGVYREPGHDDYAAFVRGSAHTVRGDLWELR